MSWSALHVWALISDGVIAPPWREFERIWELPDLKISSSGRISLALELRDRLLADVHGERPELLHRVGRWIDERLQAAITSAGDSSLGATVGEVYRDRVAHAAGIDRSGSRIRRLAQSGLVSSVAAQIGSDERKLWRIRDPRTTLMTRLRGPLLALTLMSAAGFSAASMVAPARHEVSWTVPIDAGLFDAIDVRLDSVDLDSNQERDGVIATDSTLAVVGESDAARAVVGSRRSMQRRVPPDAAEDAAIDADEGDAIDMDMRFDNPQGDDDHDRILNKDDKCPSEPETYNGFEDEDGCPDRGHVWVTDTSIEILDYIYFEYDGKRFDADLGGRLNEYFELGARGRMRMDDDTSLTFTASDETPAAFGYKAGQLRVENEKWSFYPEIISNVRDDAGSFVMAPYLPARGVVLMGLDEP